MRRTCLLATPLLFLCALVPAVVGAGELEDAVAANVTARGGEERLRALRSVRMTGRMVFPGAGLEAPLTLVWKAPNKLRLEFTFQGMTAVQAYDGHAGWTIMPFRGQIHAEPAGGEELRLLEEQADFHGPFVDTESKGYVLSFLGREDVAGRSADKIKVTNKHGEETIVYLDAERHLEIRSEVQRTIGDSGTAIEIETTPSDYREVEGLLLPHAIEGKPKGAAAGQSLVFDKIELNVDVADEEFAIPAPPPAAEPSAGAE
jgi:outer membrane lipoprotein-sorting protein